MQAHQEEFAVALMCELFRVSRSGYYARLGRSFPSKRTLENQRLCVKIRAVFEANKGRYGSVRIRKALLESGETISRRRVCKLIAIHAPPPIFKCLYSYHVHNYTHHQFSPPPPIITTLIRPCT